MLLSSFFPGLRVCRKRGPSEAIPKTRQANECSDYPPRWLIPPHTSKTPKQPPAVAFGTRVDPRTTNKVPGEKSSIQAGSPKKPVKDSCNITSKSALKPKAPVELIKYTKNYEAESSTGDTDDILVDGLVEVLMNATRFSEAAEETMSVSCTLENGRNIQSMKKVNGAPQGAPNTAGSVDHAADANHVRCVAFDGLSLKQL